MGKENKSSLISADLFSGFYFRQNQIGLRNLVLVPVLKRNGWLFFENFSQRMDTKNTNHIVQEH